MALALATLGLADKGLVRKNPIMDHVAAVSVGILDGEVRLDLEYEEDQVAETDLNLVMTGQGGLIEVQGTAEKVPYSRAELDQMLNVGAAGIEQLVKAQAAALQKARA